MRLRRFCLLLAAAVLAFASVPVNAALLIEIDKSTQKMTVVEDGETIHVWPVSTGKNGYDTPSGEYKPFRMEKDHYSREWDDAPMPNSIFFTQIGHAIHGTFDEKNLGKPASHGCVRLSRTNSETLWRLLRKHKMANTRVVLDGEIPAGAEAPATAQRQRDLDYQRRYSNDDYDDEPYYQPPPRRRQTTRNWREYNEGPRYYYYREAPQRYYRAPPPPFPFPFGW
ncbi:MAG: L,D-transpeptidase [Pseudolabrys sp.]